MRWQLAVGSLPDQFRLEECQVPSLEALVPWSQKRFGSVHPRVLSWLASIVFGGFKIGSLERRVEYRIPRGEYAALPRFYDGIDAR